MIVRRTVLSVILVKVADALDNVALAESASLTLDWCRRYLTIVAHNLVSEMKVDALCNKMKSRDEQASRLHELSMPMAETQRHTPLSGVLLREQGTCSMQNMHHFIFNQIREDLSQR